MQLVSKVKEIKEIDGEYIVETTEGKIVVSVSNCDCIFRNSMLLPCRHIFALRTKLSETLFDPSLCDKRWTAAYYRANQRLFLTTSIHPSVNVQSACKGKRKLSQHEKYHKALLLTSELVSVASIASQFHFDRRLKVLNDLLTYWKNNEEVAIVEADMESKILIYLCCLLILL